MDQDDKCFYNYFSAIKLSCKKMLNKLEEFDRYWY